MMIGSREQGRVCVRYSLVLIATALVGILGSTSEVSAQCSADYVLSNISGSWKVNNAFGQGFGGYFWRKPRVNIRVQRNAIRVDNGGSFSLTNFRYEANPTGGFWCVFAVEPTERGRMTQDEDGGWVLEFGDFDDRTHRVELVKEG